MIGELLCPDCGGVVGATETTEAGPPCRCFVSAGTSTSETVSDLPMPADAPSAKVCRICGKDVTGQKRLKDHLGYYCYECAKEEEKKLNQGRIRCKVCGLLTKEENIQTVDGTRMCHRCRHEQLEVQKNHLKKIGFENARTREELRRTYVTALKTVLALLVMLLIMSYGIVRLVQHLHKP